MAKQVMFPVEFIELQQEVLRHPPLLAELGKAVGNPDFADKIAFIAAYCDIPVNEVMGEETLKAFCDMLTMCLRGKRTGLVSTTIQ